LGWFGGFGCLCDSIERFEGLELIKAGQDFERDLISKECFGYITSRQRHTKEKELLDTSVSFCLFLYIAEFL
jgi:hypothetical protein